MISYYVIRCKPEIIFRIQNSLLIVDISSYYMQDAYFDDESAEVVISSLRLGDDQGRWVY